MAFRKAERRQAKLRLALTGPSGSGKTYGALLIAQGMGGRIAFIDTENGSSELYADLCDFDVCRITAPFTTDKYIAAIHEAEREGYDTIVIDSLTHAWNAEGGILEFVDKKKGRGNDFAAWKDATPLQNGFVSSITQSPCHIIATMRSKTAYDLEKDPQTGKLKPIKVGLAPIQRDGMEYEFTVVLDIDQQRHLAEATKDRTSLFDGKIFQITPDVGAQLKAWLETGLPAEQIQPRAAARTQMPPQQDRQLTPEQQAQRTLIGMLCDEAGLGLRKDECSGWIKQTLGRADIKGMGELTLADLDVCIQTAQAEISAKVA